MPKVKAKPVRKPRKIRPVKSTLVSFLLDETGSMQDCIDKTIQGFNGYVEGLKKLEKHGVSGFSLTRFNSLKIETDQYKDLRDVPKLDKSNYFPQSMTPLYDAIGKTIQAIGTPDQERVLFIIMTDGEDNWTKEFNRERVFKLIEGKTKDGWEFVFLGANQDAYASGAAIGIKAGSTMSYDTAKTGDTYNALSMSTRSFVSGTPGKFFDPKLKAAIEPKK